MAISAVGNQAGGFSASSATHTFSVTIPSMTDGVLLVKLGYISGFGRTISAEANNVDMGTPVTEQFASNFDTLTPFQYARSAVYALVNPTAGTYNIELIASGVTDYIYGDAVWYEGVDQTTPVEGSGSVNQPTTASTTSPDATATATTTGAWLVGMSDGYGGAATAGTGATTQRGSTEFWDSNAAVSAGSKTVNFTAASGPWRGVHALVLKPSGGGGGGSSTVPLKLQLLMGA